MDRRLDEEGGETDEGPVAVIVDDEEGNIHDWETHGILSDEAEKALAEWLESRPIVEV